MAPSPSQKSSSAPNPSISIFMNGIYMTTSRRYKTRKEAIASFKKYPMILTPYGERRYEDIGEMVARAKITAVIEEGPRG